MKGLIYTISIFLALIVPGFASSPNGATIPPAAQIVDANGGVWTVPKAGGWCYLNGVHAATCNNVKTLLFYNNAIYDGTTSGTWYSWTGSYWISVAGDLRPPNNGQSPNGATIPPATQIVDASGGVWTVPAIGGSCYLNNQVNLGCTSVQTLLVYNGNIFFLDTTGAWRVWMGVGWIQINGDPRSNATLFLNPSQWVLTVDQDFTRGDSPSLYTAYCGSAGNKNSNFSAKDLFWQNAALVLKFEATTNTS